MNDRDARTDSDRLRAEAYADSSHLRRRLRLHDFARRRVDFANWALDRAAIAPGARVLDVGCGPGQYLRRLRDRGVDAVGADLSIGMASEARPHAPTLVADAQRLPVAPGTFDALLAMHMLYHVPDVIGAIDEFARVLRADGALIVSTNGLDHMRELRVLVGEAARLTGIPSDVGARSFERIDLDNVESFTAHRFAETARHEHRDTIEVDVTAPVIAYIDSLRSLYVDIVDGDAWTSLVAHAARILTDHIAEHGHWHTQQHAGVVVFRRADQFEAGSSG